MTRSTRLDALWATFLAVLVAAPILGERGYTLRGDMVFVPDQPWKPAWLGLDGGVPRSVPGDALTWLGGLVLPGDLLQKAVLVSTLALVGVGTARLVRTTVGEPEGASPVLRWLVGAAPATLAIWNPYVYERLSIGHWALLCGYAALPWAVLGARSGRLLPVALPVAVAAWTSPTGGLLAALTAVVAVAARPGPPAPPAAERSTRSVVRVLGVVTLVNLPWIVPGVLAPGPVSTGAASPVSGTVAFAARADTPWGGVGSLLSFGGLWKESAAPPGREAWFLSGVALLLSLAGLLGLVAWYRRTRDPLAPALGALAAGGLLLAWLPMTGAGQDLLTWLGEAVPGGGLLRDSQKWVAPLVVAVCVGLGEVGRRWASRERAGPVPLVVATVLPLAVLPGLAWGLGGQLHSVSYPQEWYAVRAVLERAGAADERTAVLPLSVYRRFPWNEQTAVLDPAPRFFPGDVVVDDALPVEDGVVAGEDRSAAALRAASGTGEELARVLAEEGIRFVLLERTTPGAADVELPPGRVLHEGEELVLVDLRGEPESGSDDRG